jgi:hypothetical protein
MDFGATMLYGGPKERALRFLRRGVDYRRQFDSRRAIFYRQYIGQRDAQKFPDNSTNRANTFVPYPLSNVETIVSRVDDAFFSFAPWFEVDGVTQQDDHAAESMQLILDKKLLLAKFKAAFESLVRNIAIYGFGALKVDWNWDFKTLTKPTAQYATGQDGQPILDPNTGQPILLGYKPQTTQVPMACPLITAIDIYDIVVDPDGDISACLTERTLGDIKRSCQAYKAATGQDYFYPTALTELEQYIAGACPENPESVLVRYAEVWDNQDQSCTLVTFGEDKDAIAWKDLRASYRATAYSPYKRKLYDGPPILLWSGPNQFDHKRNPILYTSYIKLPNELYGIGAIEVITDLTEAMNKFVCMTTDNWNMAINRRYAYDTNADIDHEQLNQANVPGGKVGVNGNPSEVLVPLPFFTPNQGDYAILDLYKGMIEMGSGISDFYGKSVGSPTGNRTATGINSVINESNYRFKLFIRNLELDILQPMLAMCSSMIQQYMSDKEEVLITKTQTPLIPKWQMIDPEEIIGNYEFNLTAANYATNKTVRQRNLMTFAQIAMNSPYWNQGEGLREIAKVLEIRNANDMIKSDQQVQQEQQAAQAAQQQEMFIEKVLDTESAMAVAEQGNKFKAQQASARSSGKNPHKPVGTPKRPEGRPAGANHNPSLAGASDESAVREFSQAMGGNATGLTGLHGA